MRGFTTSEPCQTVSTSSASRANKSNRAQGDLFEVLVIRDLVDGLTEITGSGTPTFDYERDLAELSAQVEADHPSDGVARLARQRHHAAAVKNDVLDLVRARARAKGPVVGISWSGRVRDTTTTADVVLRHARRGRTELTLKSVTSGSGTNRNATLTGALLRRFVEAADMVPEFAALNPKQFEAARAVLLTLSGPARLAEISSTRALARKRMTPGEKAACKSVGHAACARTADLFLEMLTRLNENLRRALFEELLGKSTPDLFVVVANDKTTFVGPARSVPGAVTLERSEHADARSLWLLVDGTRTLRISFNCTNGLGISPLCVRSFAPSDDNLGE